MVDGKSKSRQPHLESEIHDALMFAYLLAMAVGEEGLPVGKRHQISA